MESFLGHVCNNFPQINGLGNLLPQSPKSVAIAKSSVLAAAAARNLRADASIVALVTVMGPKP
jgi:hypothetical protein